MNQLEQLRAMTTVVADTGDIESMVQYQPQDATTNPSLILQAVQMPQYQDLVREAVVFAKEQSRDRAELFSLLIDRLLVNFGVEILRIVPGRVSTEVDARLSFDVPGSVAKARQLVAQYESRGIPRERVLIKLASTWEGVQGAKILEPEGIHCNMTLMFCLPQAVACAQAGATLISPFVGRILDWYVKNTATKEYAPADDPGVRSVTAIYNYFKKYGYRTQVMGASFRNIHQITELAGCDLLTISPSLLKELSDSTQPLTLKLDPAKAKESSLEQFQVDESFFRYSVNQDPMACDKLADGIRRFAQDTIKLEQQLVQQFQL